MRSYALILLSILSTSANAQWLTLPNAQTGFLKPIDEFKINPYTNELWSAKSYGMGDGITKLNENGIVTHYSEATLGNQFWIYGDIKIGFTSNNVYYSREQDGLYNLNNGNPNLIFGLQDIFNLRNDSDTLYINRFAQFTYTLVEPNLPNLESYYSDVVSKNGLKFVNLGQINFIENSGFTSLINDSYYLNNPYSIQFKKQTDSLYIGFENGLSVCYKDQCYDTITPYNTINMPSGKIAEIEFDKDDNLWCAFADFSPTPQIDSYHALAKLEGNTWQVYDTTNTPFNWDAYLGMEIDTLGNVWVATGNNLHVLQSNSNPAWLNTIEPEKETFNIYPNPATDYVNVNCSQNINGIQLFDLTGKKMANYSISNIKHTKINTAYLPKGIYIIELLTNTGVLKQKIVVE